MNQFWQPGGLALPSLPWPQNIAIQPPNTRESSPGDSSVSFRFFIVLGLISVPIKTKKKQLIQEEGRQWGECKWGWEQCLADVEEKVQCESANWKSEGLRKFMEDGRKAEDTLIKTCSSVLSFCLSLRCVAFNILFFLIPALVNDRCFWILQVGDHQRPCSQCQDVWMADAEKAGSRHLKRTNNKKSA